MENEKISLWNRFKNFVKKIMPGKKAAVTLGIAASAIGANVDKAEASDYIIERTDKKVISELSSEFNANPVDLKNSKVSAKDLKHKVDSRSNLEKTVDTIGKVQRGVHSIENVADSISDLGRSSSISSTLDNTGDVLRSVQKGEKTISQVLYNPTEKESKNSEVKQDEVVIEKVNKDAIVKESVQDEKNSTETVTEKVQPNKNTIEKTVISNENNLEVSSDEPLEVNEDDGKYSASHVKYNPDNNEFLPSMNYINRVIARTLPASHLTAGENISMIADARIDLIRYQNIAKQQGNMEVVEEIRKALIECDKYYVSLQREAIKNANEPEYDLHTPESYTNYKSQESTVKADIVQNVEDSTVISSIDEKKLENVSIGQMGTFENLDDLLDNAIAEKEKKEAVVERASTEKVEINEDKLNNVSIGQMGAFEDLDNILVEEINKKENKDVIMKQHSATKVEIDEDKLNNVSIGQMGTFENLDDMLDHAIVEKEKKTSTIRQSIDKHKANTNKITFDTPKKDTINRYFEDEER